MERRAVILAGGKGSRLGPYTTVLPKPLLPVGDRAIMDVVVRQLAGFGFTDQIFAVGYLSHLIRAVFGDGSQHGVSIRYHEEERPLGTAGPLAMIEGLDEPFLVMNGDVLTTLDFGALYRAHVEAGGVFTVATHRRSVRADYGVLHLDGRPGQLSRVIGYEEKPEMRYSVSMGVYVLDPVVLQYIPKDEPLDVPDLVHILLDAGEQVFSYPYEGYWLDIGRHDDYEKAIAEYESVKHLVLPERAAGTIV